MPPEESPPPEPPLAAALRRLKDRYVVRWGIGYLAFAAALLGVIEMLSGHYEWGRVTVGVLLVLLAFGLPFAVVVAWFHGEQGQQRMTRRETFLLMGIALAAGGSAWHVAGSGPGSVALQTTSPNEDWTSVAMLPCTTASGAPDGDYLGNRWSAELIRKLARIDGVRPKDWSTMVRYRRSGLTPAQIAGELGTSTVVRCHVIEDQREVELTLDLLQTDDSSILWSETFRGPPDRGSVNAVQSAAVLDLASALGVRVDEESTRGATRPLTQDTAALRLYRLGAHFFDRLTTAGYRKATVYFDSAIARDPSFAQAYSALARTKVFLGSVESLSGREYLPEAGQLLRKALALDRDLAEAWTWMGTYLLGYTYDWEAAEEHHRRAIALAPGSWRAHMWYGFFLQETARLDQAITKYRDAVAIDPVNPLPRLHLARALALDRQLDQASEENRRGSELVPDNYAFAHNQAIILLLQGHRDSAGVVMERSPNPYSWVNGPLYAYAGRPELTRLILDSLEARADTAAVDPLHIALQHVGLGHRHEALEWLERAYADRSSLLLYAIGSHIWTDPLRGDPEFEALRARVGFRDRHRPTPDAP